MGKPFFLEGCHSIFIFIFVGGRLKLCHAPEKSHHSVVFCVFEMRRCMPMPNLTSLTVFENLRFSDPKHHARVRLRFLSACPGLSISDFDETCIIFFVLVPLTCFLIISWLQQVIFIYSSFTRNLWFSVKFIFEALEINFVLLYICQICVSTRI